MSDPLTDLQAAATAVGLRLGVVPWEVRIVDPTGREVVRLALGSAQPAVEAKPVAPQPVGWHFERRCGFFNGKLTGIHGNRLKLLKVLAESATPVSIDEMRVGVWNDYLCEEATIRWTIHKLREDLKSEFPDYAQPFIVSEPGVGYQLTMR